jgi:hypothetical protein
VKLRKALTRVKGYEQLDLRESLPDLACNSAPQGLEPLTRFRRDDRCVRVLERELPPVLFVEQVNLVHDEQAGSRAGPDLLQDRVRRSDRVGPLGVGLRAIHHVENEVGEDRLLEGGLEGLNELMRQLANEPDRVGEQIPATLVLEGPRCRVQRVEEPLPHAHASAGESVQEGRLAGVRVTGEGDRRQCRPLAAGSHHGAVSLHTPQLAPQGGDPVAREAAVGLDLGLAGASGPDPAVHPPGAEALEVGPQPTHAGEVVLELGEFHLQVSLCRVGVVREDVEDHRGAVDHGDPQLLLEIALLPRGELVVAGDQIRVGGLDRPSQLGELPPAEIAVGIRLGASLHELPGRRDAGGAQKLLELRDWVVAVLVVSNDPDGERALTRPGIDDSGGAVGSLIHSAKGYAPRWSVKPDS